MMRARLFIAFLIVILPFYGNALSTSQTASVQILTALSISELQQLNFGKVIPPVSGGQNIRVQRDGTYGPNSAGTLGSFQKEGDIKVTGEPGAQFTVTATTSSTIPGVTFTSLLYPAAAQTFAAHGANAGQKIITIGGVIRVLSSAVPGNYNSGQLSYALTITYQ